MVKFVELTLCSHHNGLTVQIFFFVCLVHVLRGTVITMIVMAPLVTHWAMIQLPHEELTD